MTARNTSLEFLENVLAMLRPISEVARAVSPGADGTDWISIQNHMVMRHGDLRGVERASGLLRVEIRRRHDGKKTTALRFLLTLRGNIDHAVRSWTALRPKVNQVHAFIGVWNETPRWLEVDHLNALLDFDTVIEAEIVRRRRAAETRKAA
jgi:hypothetical protein